MARIPGLLGWNLKGPGQKSPWRGDSFASLPCQAGDGPMGPWVRGRRERGQSWASLGPCSLTWCGHVTSEHHFKKTQHLKMESGQKESYGRTGAQRSLRKQTSTCPLSFRPSCVPVTGGCVGGYTHHPVLQKRQLKPQRQEPAELAPNSVLGTFQTSGARECEGSEAQGDGS